MTVHLSDAPEFLAACDIPARAGSIDDLAAGERRLWGLLGGGDRVWIGREATRSFWHSVVVVREAPASQMDVLHRHLGRDLPLEGPVACLALTGRGFHGQRGRPWAAVTGNLHLSVAVAPRRDLADLGVGLTLLPAVAAQEAVESESGGRLAPDFKWVNDLLVGGKKVGGVLTTTLCQWQRVEVAVMGIGLNVAEAPRLPPTPFVPAVGRLRGCAGGEDLAVAPLFVQLLETLAGGYESLCRDGPSSLFEAYRRRSLVLGRAVRVWDEGLDDTAPPDAWPSPLLAGVVTDMGADLSLCLADHAERVWRGRLAFEEACREYGL